MEDFHENPFVLALLKLGRGTLLPKLILILFRSEKVAQFGRGWGDLGNAHKEGCFYQSSSNGA